MIAQKIREETRGKLTLRLTQTNNGFVGALIGDPGGQPTIIHGTDQKEVWYRMELAVGKHHPNYFGFDGARARFLRFFPNGFLSPGYGERDYKIKAKEKLNQTVPLAEAATGSGFGIAVLRAFAATNLLSKFEMTRLQPMLHGPSADAFIRAAASFALGCGAPALAEMDGILQKYDNAKWPVVTYLPFLWRPDEHMFLKPTVTKDFATRVGHPFAKIYKAGLDMAVYESLLDLVARTEAELADLQPQDRIDVQSFIWVVGAYEEALATPTS
jgi:hypothetical protein